MFGIGLPELGVILVVATLVFGPDRIPEYARQAGRLLREVRRFAANAQADLREELGPEFADLNLTDLDPRTAVRKHLLEGLSEPPEKTRRTPETQRPTASTPGGALGPGETPPFDSDAT